MARSIARFSALEVGRLAKSKVDRIRTFHDGGGLYLVVDGRRHRDGEDPSASWVYRYMFERKARSLGLGSYPEITLADARGRAAEARRLKAHGVDPVDAKHEAKAARKAELARAVTFKDVAEDYIRLNSAGWKNPRQEAQWSSSLKAYAYPIIGSQSVGAIDAAAVLGVLQQEIAGKGKQARRFWEARPETASRVRGRIEAILDYAKVKGFRSGDNPAAWRGNLKLALPARSKVRKVKHHEAMAFGDLPVFAARLQTLHGLSARALEFAILTAARTSEVLGARWCEFDLDAHIWLVPAERMKARREHRVPLASRAVEILREVRPRDADDDDFAFPGSRPGKPLSNMCFLMLLRRTGHGDLTAHGFRSTFRDWVSEKTDYSGELAEMALAHTIGDRVEAAYRRGDLFEKRWAPMVDWAAYCASGGGGPAV